MCAMATMEQPITQWKVRPFEEALNDYLTRSGTEKRRLERLLVEIDRGDADRLTMLIKESRGSIGMLLSAPTDGDRTALVLGNAVTGTAIALVSLGYHVTVADTSGLRLAFARERARALAPERVAVVRIENGSSLPFAEDAFEVVVREGAPPGPEGALWPCAGARSRWAHDPTELRRVARREVFCTVENRFAYKRSQAQRGVFDRSLLGTLRQVLTAPRGERSRHLAERTVRGPWPRSSAWALYPCSDEFSHLVSLSSPMPRLTIGRRERTNRVKVIGRRLGLFPYLTPSFGVHAVRETNSGASRLQRILDAAGERLGCAPPVAEIVVATRSNNVIVQTSRAGDGRRWTLHVPLQPCKLRLVTAHHDWLGRVRARHGTHHAPEPLYCGALDGVWMSIEERVDGLAGTEVTGDAGMTGRMLCSAAARLAELRRSDLTPEISEARFGELMDERVALVVDHVWSPGTARDLEERAERLRHHAIGRLWGLYTFHADLRGKHAMVANDGTVRAFLDWGASEEFFFPFADLAQLLVHQRAQESGGSLGEAWRALCDPELRRPWEAEAIEIYRRAAGLEEDDVAALLDAYPLFVAGMAERNWDYSRPDWVARHFALGE